jgi:uncharacterized protein YjaZ
VSKAGALALVLIGACGACGDTTEGVRTEFVGSYVFSATERRTISRIAGATATEVRRHLPALAPNITLRVRSGKEVIPEIGATAEVAPPDWLVWTVDAERPEGVVNIAETHLRGALFHEFHHLVRGSAITPGTMMDQVITEGLATAFERDFAGESRPWADYPGEVAKWVEEIPAWPEAATRDGWFFRHPDGRRWVGYKAGTYLVDRAMKRLNRSSAELVATPADEILRAAAADHK